VTDVTDTVSLVNRSVREPKPPTMGSARCALQLLLLLQLILINVTVAIHSISLANGILVEPQMALSAADDASKDTSAGQTRMFLAQFSTPLRDMAQSAHPTMVAMATPAALFDAHSALLRSDRSALQQLSADGLVNWFTEWSPSFKLGAAVRELVAAGAEFDLPITVVATLECNDGAAESLTLPAGVSAVDGETNACFAVLRVESRAAVNALAAMDRVLWIERHTPSAPHSRDAAHVMQSDVDQPAASDPTSFYDAGIDGTGQIVHIADNGLSMRSCFFNDSSMSFVPDQVFMNARKVLLYDASFADAVGDEHGTSMSSIAVGMCAASEPLAVETNVFRGVAYNAKMTFSDLQVQGEQFTARIAIFTHWTRGYNVGARIFSNSFGDDTTGYTETDRQGDSWIANSARDALVLVSAGNDGTSEPITWTGKNVLTVASSINDVTFVRLAYGSPQVELWANGAVDRVFQRA
jgi:hypothetical protein